MKSLKVVLPVAGSGVRLFPVTKEQPKEMLPIFNNYKKNILVTPMIQLIFEQLFDYGLRNFCFIVGKNKRIIEDHFTPSDLSYFELTDRRIHIQSLLNFFKKVNQSNIVWQNQSKPLGFGHAVLTAESYVNHDNFIVHAGDTLLWPKKNNYLKNLIKCFKKREVDAAFLVIKIKDPRQYGVIDGKKSGRIIHVQEIEEKPKKPKTNYAIMPVYIFNPIIFDYIKKIKQKKRAEIQLTDAISLLVKDRMKVYALDVTNQVVHMDIGNPQSYWQSLRYSHRLLKGRSN